MTIPRNLSFLAEGASSTGVLGVANGGSAATTLTGYLIGNGTSAFTASATIPTSALSGSVSLTTQVSGTLPVGNGGTGITTLTAGYIPYGNGTSAFGSSSNLFWDSTNSRLGLGTVTPANRLHVKLTSGGNTAQFEGAGASDSYINITNTGVSNTYLGFNNSGSTNSVGIPTGVSYFANANGYPVAFSTNGVERARIHASGGVSIGNTTDPGATNLSVSGNIGAGTTSPAYKLQVFGTSSFGDGTNGQTLITSNSSINYYDSLNQAASIWQSSVFRANNFNWYTSASGTPSTGMVLDSSNNLNVNGTVKTGGYTVAGLPTGVTGARAYVTNALAPSFGATVVGGGTVTIPVFYNGTNWIVG
jgi:hypothetical protein